jgi:GNAT superfamily N-acetyltransferase
MQIRKATMEDRDAVIELLRTLLIPGGEVGESWRDDAQIFRLLVENPKLGTVLVAEENGEIAGITTLSFPTALRCCGIYSCIEENIVDERFRGRGVGGALVKAAIAEATARGCDELQVNAPSEAGYPLYLRHGFEDHGKIQVKADLPLSER